MIKMTDLRCFLLCIFGFIILIIGLSIFEFAIYSACVHLCNYDGYFSLQTCQVRCTLRRKLIGEGSYEAGITFIVLGSILALCSFPIMIRRLTNISFGNVR